jgi:hypothetical protein
LVFPIIALKNFFSVAWIILSSLIVHVHVFNPYNSIFLKYTLYILVLYFLSMSLFQNMLYIKW